ncbi:unnamed protein product [Urochloa decumbens]|uniref:Uncharacterized protein n=1 Tax=Urochloa decumbens TaxID=240449 RepID=A0ABC9ESC9_9POAL
MEALSLIDVSAEDDFLLDVSTPPRAPAPPRHPDPTHAGSLVDAKAAAAEGRAADPDGVMEEQAAPERTESPKQRKAKAGVNLRKSLAWDSAFFTSEGVLDTDELAIVNSTFRKTQGSRLPGIAEDMRKSGDSTTSTLESETWAMESLETELFDNVRASIQRSIGKPNKVPGGTSGSSKPPMAKATRIAARKGPQMPQTKIRAPVSTHQGIGGGKQRPQANSIGSAAARANMPIAAEAKTSSKPPRALPRVAMMRSSTSTAITSATSDKRSSTGGAGNRQAAGKTANTSTSVRPGVGTKSSAITKSGSFTSATNTHGVSMNTRPEANTRTTLSKNMSAQRVPVHSLPKSDISKTVPSRVSRVKIPARGHTDRASPSISPCSSVDSMSSVLSGVSIASTVGNMSHTSEGSLRTSNDCPPTPKIRPTSVTEGDNSKSAASITNQGKGFKPTGLRRPTPKIGYFDAEKSIDQNIGAQVQPQPMKIQSLLPATPKSQPPIQSMNATHQQKNDPSKSNMVKAQPLNVVQMDVESFMVAEPEPMKIQSMLPSTPKSQPPIQSMNATPHKKNDLSKSNAVTVLPLNVVQMDAESYKVAEPEVWTLQTDPEVAKPEAGQLQSIEIQCLLPATSNSTSGEQESEPTAGPHYEARASKSKAMPVKAAQLEAKPSKVAEPEAHRTTPVMAKPEPGKSIGQKVGALVQLPLEEIQCSHPATPTSQASSTFCQKESKPVAAPHEISACKSKATKGGPLKPTQMEVDPLKVAEPEACLLQPDPVVVADTPKENIPAVHKNIQANVDPSSLVDLLTQKLSSISLGEATPDLGS